MGKTAAGRRPQESVPCDVPVPVGIDNTGCTVLSIGFSQFNSFYLLYAQRFLRAEIPGLPS